MPNSAMTPKQIEAYLKEEKKKFEQFHNEPQILILGSSDCGKSTLIKQMKIIYANGFTTEEKQDACVKIMANILKFSLQYIIYLESQNALDPELKTLPEDLEILVGVEKIPVNIEEMILKLWKNSSSMEEFFKQPNIPETTVYYFKDIERILGKTYSPTNEVTMAIRETTICADDQNIHVYDVSGLDEHRKQWLPYFDHVNSVIFVSAVSSYDQRMVENPEKNRMVDSIELFGSLYNHPLLAKVKFILLLNKRDIFEEKVSKVNIVDHFPDYTGAPGNSKQGIEYFKKRYLTQKRSTKDVGCHITCCTDTISMRMVIKQVLFNVMERNLSGAMGGF